MKRLILRIVFLGVATTLLVAGVAHTSYAIPILQLYIEGSFYDSSTDTWVLESDGEIRLWVIGNVEGEGGKGDILNVKLAAAYDSPSPPLLAPTITLTGSTTDGFAGYTDDPFLSTPDDETVFQTVTDGSSPLLTDLSPLPPHGIYGAGTDWQEFELGDFTEKSSQIEDFINAVPTASSDLLEGQINVYVVSISGLAAGDTIHFDMYDNVIAGNHIRYVFAPFSHDAEVVPEPSTLLLLGSGLAGLGLWRLRQRKYA